MYVFFLDFDTGRRLIQAFCNLLGYCHSTAGCIYTTAVSKMWQWVPNIELPSDSDLVHLMGLQLKSKVYNPEMAQSNGD